MANYRGGCLCGHIRYSSSATPIRPHFCSCRMCQQWSGAPIVAWVDFPQRSPTFDGLGGEPAFFRSSEWRAEGLPEVRGLDLRGGGRLRQDLHDDRHAG